MVRLYDLNEGLEVHMHILNYVYLLLGPLTRGRSINWIKRLEIAKDSAKGIFIAKLSFYKVVLERIV